MASLPEESLTNPVSVGVMFCNALSKDHVHYRTALSNLVTPESLNAWGDFSGPAAFLNGLPDMGYGSKVNEAVGAPDVVYFKILQDVATAYEVLDEQPIDAAAVLQWSGDRSTTNGSSTRSAATSNPRSCHGPRRECSRSRVPRDCPQQAAWLLKSI